MERSERIRELVSSLLDKAEIPNSIVQELLDDDAISAFNIAFTHKTFNDSINYELDEFLGDSIVNFVVAKFVLKEFKVTNSKEATLVKHHIQSNKLLGGLAEKYGIVSLLKIALEEKIDEKIKGDVFESFIGCLYKVVERKKMQSTAFIICYKLISYMLNQLELIRLRKGQGIEVWQDAVSKFKEQYLDYYKWPIDYIKETSLGKGNGYSVQIFGKPNNQGSPILLYEAKGSDKARTKISAARGAMIKLQQQYKDLGKLKTVAT